MAIQAAVQAFE
jgi:hypothetical protein